MPVRATTVSSAQSYRYERRAARQQRQAERQEQRRQAREAKNPPAPVSTTPANVTAPSVPATASESPKSETKNFIGGTAGANVVNFAVQGGRGGNRLAIFGSGEGPNAVKPQEKSADTAKTEAESPKVDTVA